MDYKTRKGTLTTRRDYWNSKHVQLIRLAGENPARAPILPSFGSAQKTGEGPPNPETPNPSPALFGGSTICAPKLKGAETNKRRAAEYTR